MWLAWGLAKAFPTFYLRPERPRTIKVLLPVGERQIDAGFWDCPVSHTPEHHFCNAAGCFGNLGRRVHLLFKAQQLFQQTAQHQCLVLDRCLGRGDGKADLCPGARLASTQVLSRSFTLQGDTLVLSLNESWALSGKARCRPGKDLGQAGIMRSEHGGGGKGTALAFMAGALSWLVSKKGRKDDGSKAQTHMNSPAGEGDAAR